VDVGGNSRLVPFCVQLHPAVALMISSNWVGQEVGEGRRSAEEEDTEHY
jgi:hypothetical protein